MFYKNGIPLDGTQELEIGAICIFPTLINDDDYLLCDGSTFDEEEYPVLAERLGSNVVTDLREAILKGVGQNSTDSIATHDTFTLGQYKDDALQSHTHSYTTRFNNSNYSCVASSGVVRYNIVNVNSSAPTGCRTGTVTRGKHKGVYFYIKAR